MWDCPSDFICGSTFARQFHYIIDGSLAVSGVLERCIFQHSTSTTMSTTMSTHTLKMRS